MEMLQIWSDRTAVAKPLPDVSFWRHEKWRGIRNDMSSDKNWKYLMSGNENKF